MPAVVVVDGNAVHDAKDAARIHPACVVRTRRRVLLPALLVLLAAVLVLAAIGPVRTLLWLVSVENSRLAPWSGAHGLGEWRVVGRTFFPSNDYVVIEHRPAAGRTWCAVLAIFEENDVFPQNVKLRENADGLHVRLVERASRELFLPAADLPTLRWFGPRRVWCGEVRPLW
jgi:hypothetical protein